jgi:FF domain
LLREKDINPLLPWDTCLPQFINDPRYVLLPSVAARKEAFDEYCRERARELRETAVKKEKSEANPKEDFDRLLKEEVKSTRTSWTEFRRTWKKDRRFYGWGRDDREREKAFRDYLKALGESMSFPNPKPPMLIILQRRRLQHKRPRQISLLCSRNRQRYRPRTLGKRYAAVIRQG